jgi:hypothetical protein
MNNVLDLISEKGISPRKVSSTNGGEYASSCPDCGGKDRFRIWPEQKGGSGLWWCRQCGKHGDNIQFLVEFCGMDFKAACKYLGIEKPESLQPLSVKTNKESWSPAPAISPAEKWKTKAGKFAEWAHEQLLNNKEQLFWLAARGINIDSVKKFFLGWNPDDFYRPREAWGLSIIKNEKTGKDKKLWIPAGLVIPMQNNENIERLRIRKVDKKTVPYFIVPGSSTIPILIHNQSKRVACVVVESELDGMLIAQEAGDLVCVIAVGNTTVRPSALQYKFMKQASCILVSMDFDGKPGAVASHWWLKQFNQAIRWPVLKGKDPGEAFKEGINIREWILAGLPPAWTIGGYGQKNSKMEREDYVQEVEELYNLLLKYPVKIICNEYIDFKWPDCKKEDKVPAERLIELIFYNGDVTRFLKGHPDEVITKENYFY